jgi:mono/diheme cytochrome c family protein
MAAFFAGASAAEATTTAAATEIAAWYTEEQADRGRRAYPPSCGGCHGASMAEIFSQYEDAASYYRFISGSMPADNPGGLATRDYLDIVAYLMQEIGFPSGTVELNDGRETLAQIKVLEALDVLGYNPFDEQYDPDPGRQP